MMTSGAGDEQPSILTGADALTPPPEPGPSGGERNREGGGVAPYLTPFGPSDPRAYFAHRSGLVRAAVDECAETLVFPGEDGALVGAWLLTEISSWDNERERIVVVTEWTVMVIKYDFIAMKKMEFRRVPLSDVDTVCIGGLVYPKSSLVPRINGLSDGIVTAVRECVLGRFRRPNAADSDRELRQNSTEARFDFKNFEPRDRNMTGVRILWNRGQPVPFVKKWNPFETDIPYDTFTYHPLYFHEGDQKDMFDVEKFTQTLVTTIERLQNTEEQRCAVQHNPIVLQSYVGLVPFVHNKSSLGFFKNRGKFSF